MATLAGNSIASSYTSLLKLNGNTDSTAAGNGSNAIQVKTGDDDATPLFLNTDRVGIGVQPYSPLHIKSDAEGSIGGLEATDGTFIPQVIIEGSGTTAAKMSPTLALFNSSTGADGDTLGSIMFIGGDDSNQPPSTIAEGSVYAGILAKITDETNSSNDGELHFLATSGNDNTNTAMSIVGSNVGIGTSPESVLHINTSSSGGIGGKLIIDNQASDADGNGTEISFFNAAGASASGVSSSRIRSVASGNTNGYSQLQFWTYHASEGHRMTLSSDGNLGLGNAGTFDNPNSASRVLEIATASPVGLILNDTRDANPFCIENRGAVLHIAHGTTSRLVIDESGRLGLGTTPKAFTLFTPLQISTSAVLTGRSGHNQLDLANNWYYDGAEKRINTGYVARYTQNSSGEHQFLTAGTDSADSSITFGTAKLTIDNAGNVGIGIADGDGKVHIYSGSAGSVTAGTSGDDLVVENSGDAGISILSPDANSSRVQFGSANNNNIGHIGGFYNSGAFQLFFNVNGTNRFILDANSRISLSNNDSGGTGGRDSTSGNTIFGYSAGNVNSGAVNNTFIGHASGSGSINGGDNNTAIGAETLQALTTASGNQAIGSYSGFSITTGGNNVLLGNDTGFAITETANTVLIGHQSGTAINNTGASGTVAVGFESLKALTSGNGNTAIGYQALKTNIDGDRNTAVGFGALVTHEADTDGHGENSALGYQAGGAINTGTGNTLIGSRAGNQGTNDITTGDNNTMIGVEAKASASAGTNQIVIGHSATGQANNSVTLGNADVTAVYMAQDSGATVHCAGINFSATQPAPDAGTSSSEVLDGYEEGIFTPTLTTNATDFTSVTYDSLVKGKYTKIGNIVHVQGFLRTDAVNKGSASGDVSIGGLPFTAGASTSGTANGHAVISIGNASGWTGENPSHGLVIAGGTIIQLYYADYNVDPNNIAVSDVTDGTSADKNSLYFAGTYTV